MKLLSTRACKAVLGIGVLGLVLSVPSIASADILTYRPPGPGGVNDNDLNDLDHYFMYTWRIQDALGAPAPDSAGSVFSGMSVTSAVLTFSNLNNWQAEPNALYLTLLDTAYAIGTNLNADGDPTTTGSVAGWNNADTDDLNQVTYYQDIASGDTSLQLSNGYTNGVAKFLVNASTPRTFLTAQSFPGPGGDFPLSNTYEASAQDPTINDEGLGAGWAKVASDTSNPFSYTYTFNSTQLTTLNNYIYNSATQATNPFDFAIGFDPDCHFNNSGISLTLITSPVGTAMPEPSSLLLLGTGLIGAARRFRKARKA